VSAAEWIPTPAAAVADVALECLCSPGPSTSLGGVEEDHGVDAQALELKAFAFSVALTEKPFPRRGS
jgi:hypothetical protein